MNYKFAINLIYSSAILNKIENIFILHKNIASNVMEKNYLKIVVYWVISLGNK